MSNNETSTNLTTSSNNKNGIDVIRDMLQPAMYKYNNTRNEYYRFFQQFPVLEKREGQITSAYDAVRRGGKSLAGIDSYFGKGATEVWLKIMIVEQLSFLGAFDSAKVGQIKMLASKIRQEYHYLTPSELTHFFYKFSLGDYGKLYAGRTINPQEILIGLKEFSLDINNARVRFEEEKKATQREKELAEWKKDCVSLEEWKKMRGMGDKPSNIEMISVMFGEENNKDNKKK